MKETRGIIYPAETKNGRGGKKQKWVAEISVNNQRYRFQSTNRGNVTAWLKGMNAGVASRGKKMTLETYKEMQRVLSGLAREINCSIQDPDTKKTRSATAHLNSRKKGVNEAKKCLRQYFFEKIKTA